MKYLFIHLDLKLFICVIPKSHVVGFVGQIDAEDFRTEVLGLMKAQTVKNSVIVPSGAKGGFVLKAVPLQGYS